MDVESLPVEQRRLARLLLAEVDARIAISDERCAEGQKRLSDDIGERMRALELAAAKESGANEEFRDQTVRVLESIQTDVKANGEAAVQGAQMAAQTAETLGRISDRLYEMNGREPENGDHVAVQALQTVAKPWAAVSIALLILAAAAGWYMLGGTAQDLTDLPAAELSE